MRKDAVEAQVEAQVEVLYHRCYRILQDKEQAWDALQEVITRFIEMASHQTIHKPEHYLFRISTTHCLELLRQQKRTFPLQEFHQNAPAPLVEAVRNHDGKAQIEGKLVVEKLLARFGEEAVRLLLHRHVDQMTYKEIAALLDLTPPGAKYRLERLEEQVLHYLNS